MTARSHLLAAVMGLGHAKAARLFGCVKGIDIARINLIRAPKPIAKVHPMADIDGIRRQNLTSMAGKGRRHWVRHLKIASLGTLRWLKG